eukprot:2455837-Amphidinium_carterae.2
MCLPLPDHSVDEPLSPAEGQAEALQSALAILKRKSSVRTYSMDASSVSNQVLLPDTIVTLSDVTDVTQKAPSEGIRTCGAPMRKYCPRPFYPDSNSFG